MTAFLIGFPSIPFTATSVSMAVASEDSTYPVKNVITGPRQNLFQTSAAVTAAEVKFDLGASATAAINYGFIARAKLFKSQGVTTALFKSSPDDAVYTSRLGANATFQSKTFSGPRSEDFFCASGFNDDVAGTLPTSVFRHWRLVLAASSAKVLSCSKIYCGTLFDFGSEPRVREFNLHNQSRTLRSRDPFQSFTLNWKNVSTTVRNSFISNIGRWGDVNPVVLYDSGDAVFNGSRTMHASIASVRWSERTVTQWDVSISFEEQI